MGAATRGFTGDVDRRPNGIDAATFSDSTKFANTVYGQTAALHVELNELEKSASQLEDALAGVAHPPYPKGDGRGEVEAVQAVPQAVEELQRAVQRTVEIRRLLEDVRSRLALS
jgi:hypothetical protein